MELKFEDNSIKVKNIIGDRAIQFLYEAAIEIQAQAIANTKTGKGTGQTKRSWRVYLKNSELEAYVGNTAEQSIYQELGTGEYAINGDGHKGNWYVPIGNGDNEMPMEIVKKYGFKVVYGKNGMKFAEVTGQRPVRALYKAFKTTKPKLIRRAKTVFGG